MFSDLECTKTAAVERYSMPAKEKSKLRTLLRLLLFLPGEKLSRWARLLFRRGNMSSSSIREEESSNTDEENRLVFYHASRTTTERRDRIGQKEREREKEKTTKEKRYTSIGIICILSKTLG